MTVWLSAGILFTFAAIAFVLYRWGNIRCIGTTPVRTFTFVAILFTSGLDVGLIMFEPPRPFYQRERALWTPQPEQLLAVAQ